MADKIAKKRADEQFDKIYRENYTAVYRFCISRLKDDRASVDDCVQEAFLVLYKKLLAGEEIEHAAAFLLQTANNFVMRRFREMEKSNKHYNLDDVQEIPSQSDDMDERLTFEEYSRQISSALNDKDSLLFSLRYINELSIEEISIRTDMSITNVTSSLSRLRKKIQRILGDSFFT